MDELRRYAQSIWPAITWENTRVFVTRANRVSFPRFPVPGETNAFMRETTEVEKHGPYMMGYNKERDVLIIQAQSQYDYEELKIIYGDPHSPYRLRGTLKA